MILKTHHVSTNVKNIDEVVAFFRDVLGLTLLQPVYETKGPWFDKISGFVGAHIKVAKFQLGDLRLEFLQYLTPPPSKELKGDRNDVGSYHICFLVDNIEEMYEKLKERGVKFVSPPVWVTDETHPIYGWGALYFSGPEDIALELMQAPK